MKIGLDIMGGDYAPKAAVLGAIEAHSELDSEDKLVLIGDETEAKTLLAEANFDNSLFEYVHTTEVISMGEHPTKAITQKPNSSISVGFQLLKEGQIDAFSSAGNTGAMLVGAMFSVKPIQGVSRPAIATYVPHLKAGYGIMLDVGANADCKPDHLLQFGILGSLYLEHIFGTESPNVCLLNIGEEKEKGNMLTIAAHQLLRDNKLIHFKGNIEGRDIFNDDVDVVVCDGFTGNVVLKLAESFYTITHKKKMTDDFFERFNYENYGGSPILGINAPVVIGHGISNPKAIKNMVLLSRTMKESKFIDKVKAAFNQEKTNV
ncbi:phosphate acyltransferase PlsX [Olivibacter sitiensis]|uniref:phosphate acyltransferase PlsX n=1 Tax=Olivibacter sitiensis TaxID=376470 RepID=UPI000483C4B9|nr:phosphate acyltransferase PlsX [Olivibacter sitiensis]